MFRTQGLSSGRRLHILMHVKHAIPYLYTQPSSSRWTLGFETCRRHKTIKN